MNPLSSLLTSGLVSTPQVVLLRLYTADGSGVAPGDVSESTGCTAAAVSTAVQSLITKGMAEQRHLFRDQRRRKIYLTEKGRAKAEGMLAAIDLYACDVKKRKTGVAR